MLGTAEVRSADVADPVAAVLQHVQGLDWTRSSPSTITGAYVGLLTTSTIARWLAAQLSSSGGPAEAESVGRAPAFAEPHEQAPARAADHHRRGRSSAVYQLSSGGRTGPGGHRP